MNPRAAVPVSKPVLQVHGLVKRFGGVLATDHVNLSVPAHEVHALIGPNGAGKSTLVHQLAGTLRPDGGRIEFREQDITALPVHRRVLAGVARSYQITNVFMNCSVLHNVLLAVQARSGSSFRFTGSPFDEHALLQDARAAIAAVGLAGSEHELLRAMSYGQQRRVEIALALATNPKLLLLDEPLAGMGSGDAEQMVALIQQLKQRTTIVLVEHDMGAVFRLADRITVLVYGKVIATDVPSAIRSSATVREAYLGEEATA